jgi:hypothetical protein
LINSKLRYRIDTSIKFIENDDIDDDDGRTKFHSIFHSIFCISIIEEKSLNESTKDLKDSFYSLTMKVWKKRSDRRFFFGFLFFLFQQTNFPLDEL